MVLSKLWEYLHISSYSVGFVEMLFLCHLILLLIYGIHDYILIKVEFQVMIACNLLQQFIMS